MTISSDSGKICPACDGDGELATSHKFRCYECDGRGRIYDEKKYQEVLAREKRIAANLAANVSAYEYRKMG